MEQEQSAAETHATLVQEYEKTIIELFLINEQRETLTEKLRSLRNTLNGAELGAKVMNEKVPEQTKSGKQN